MQFLCMILRLFACIKDNDPPWICRSNSEIILDKVKRNFFWIHDYFMRYCKVWKKCFGLNSLFKYLWEWNLNLFVIKFQLLGQSRASINNLQKTVFFFGESLFLFCAEIYFHSNLTEIDFWCSFFCCVS